jgi:hypothetical protein
LLTVELAARLPAPDDRALPRADARRANMPTQGKLELTIKINQLPPR